MSNLAIEINRTVLPFSTIRKKRVHSAQVQPRRRRGPIIKYPELYSLINDPHPATSFTIKGTEEEVERALTRIYKEVKFLGIEVKTGLDEHGVRWVWRDFKKEKEKYGVKL